MATSTVVKCCCQPCNINNGNCDGQHRCVTCKRYLHAICGHTYKDANGIVENLAFPRRCNDCHDKFYRIETYDSPSPEKATTKRRQETKKKEKATARKKLSLPTISVDKTPPPLLTRKSSKRKTKSLQSGTPDAEPEVIEKKPKKNKKKNGPSTTPLEDMTMKFENLALQEKSQELNDANGNNSDEEGGEFEIMQESYIRALIERNEEDNDILHIEDIANDNIAFVASKKGLLDPRNHEDYEKKIEFLQKIPEDYIVPEKKDPNQPSFNEIDNPGNWNEFVARPVYKKKGTGRTATYKYLHHELPTGCIPVPVNSQTNKREVGGWNFFTMDGTQIVLHQIDPAPIHRRCSQKKGH